MENGRISSDMTKEWTEGWNIAKMNDGNMDKDRNGGKEAEREVKEAGDEGRRERMWEEWD